MVSTRCQPNSTIHSAPLSSASNRGESVGWTYGPKLQAKFSREMDGQHMRCEIKSNAKCPPLLSSLSSLGCSTHFQVLMAFFFGGGGGGAGGKNYPYLLLSHTSFSVSFPHARRKNSQLPKTSSPEPNSSVVPVSSPHARSPPAHSNPSRKAPRRPPWACPPGSSPGCPPGPWRPSGPAP